jgi:hypothetical protein
MWAAWVGGDSHLITAAACRIVPEYWECWELQSQKSEKQEISLRLAEWMHSRGNELWKYGFEV